MHQKVRTCQEFLNYIFKEPELLARALTTPEYGNQNKVPHYESLETLGDAVAKLCLLLKLLEKGIDVPAKLTRTKQVLESNRAYLEIAQQHELWKYVIYYNIPDIKNAPLLADVFEAIIGALFFDSNRSLQVVNDVIIEKFFHDWELYLEQSTAFRKNDLLEYLQERYRCTSIIEFDPPLRRGLDHNPQWKLKKPRIYNQYGMKLPNLSLPDNLESNWCKTKKDAEKDLYHKILLYLKSKNQD